jgi:hypothetical protein
VTIPFLLFEVFGLIVSCSWVSPEPDTLSGATQSAFLFTTFHEEFVSIGIVMVSPLLGAVIVLWSTCRYASSQSSVQDDRENIPVLIATNTENNFKNSFILFCLSDKKSGTVHCLFPYSGYRQVTSLVNKHEQFTPISVNFQSACSHEWNILAVFE